MNPGSAPVVSNAGPLMVLAKLNLLHLLKELYGEVYFPQSVYEEVVIEGMRQGYEDARTLKIFLDQAGWTPREVSLPQRAVLESALEKAHVAGEIENSEVSPVSREVHLDRGEQDTLALALDLGSRLVLMDEVYGRYHFGSMRLATVATPTRRPTAKFPAPCQSLARCSGQQAKHR